MRSNVGGIDRLARSVLGPGLVLAGWRALDNRRSLALAALIGGAVITETAVTATCPVNRALRMDSRGTRQRGALREMGRSGLQVSSAGPRGYDESGRALSGLSPGRPSAPGATEPATALRSRER